MGRLALVGADGSGKSTLLRILAGQEPPDEGAVSRSGYDEAGYLPQTLAADPGETIRDVIRASVAGLERLESRMRELETRMAAAPGDDVLAEYGEVSGRFEDRGDYTIEARAGEVLASLGVGYLAQDRRVDEISGGEKARLALAALLLAAPDILLLDEPTNHLAFEVIESFQEALAEFQGPVLAVTHDRRLIRQFARTTWTLRDGRLDAEPG